MRKCKTCDKVKEDRLFTHRTDGYVSHICKQCDTKRVYLRESKRRNEWFKIYIPICERCGYDKCSAAIEYHHRDPKTKKYALAYLFKKYSPTSKKAYLVHDEIKKCETLCANCHRETHHIYRDSIEKGEE